MIDWKSVHVAEAQHGMMCLSPTCKLGHRVMVNPADFWEEIEVLKNRFRPSVAVPFTTPRGNLVTISGRRVLITPRIQRGCVTIETTPRRQQSNAA